MHEKKAFLSKLSIGKCVSELLIIVIEYISVKPFRGDAYKLRKKMTLMTG